MTTVMLVDDSRTVLMSMSAILTKSGFEVVTATDGSDALGKLDEAKPNIIISDLNMPTMDGYEAIQNLRRDLSLAGMPIVVLTSEHGPGIERRVLDLGADDYVLKPFDAGVLISRVQAVFRRLETKAA